MNRNRVLFIIVLTSMISACSGVNLVDVSEDPDYEKIIGAEYEVIGAVDAYGIRRHSGASIDYITMIPPPGISGAEVGFRVPVERGSRLAIRRVMRTNRWFDCGIAYIVTLEGVSMPVVAVTRVEMNRGNEGKDCLELNHDIYKRMI